MGMLDFLTLEKQSENIPQTKYWALSVLHVFSPEHIRRVSTRICCRKSSFSDVPLTLEH